MQTERESSKDNPISVCMLTHSIYSRDTRIRRLAEYLAADGHRVDVICLAPDTPEDPVDLTNVRVFPLPVSRRRRERLGLIFEWIVTFVLMFLSTTRLDLKNRYDLIHVHNMPDFLVFCAMLPRLRGCPVILNIHDVTPQVARSKLGLSSDHPLIRVLTAIERICIKFSTYVITETRVAAKSLIEEGAPPDKVGIVMNAADARVFEPDEKNVDRHPQSGPFTILFVGTVARRYGLETCVRALPYLEQAIPDVRLRVIPKVKHEGVALDECLALADSMGVSDLIELSDPVPLEHMPAVMINSNIGLYPALVDCHMDVSPSLKIPEMVNMGLPIVASRLSWLVELYGEDSIAFVPAGDAKALADRILELYQSPGERTRLARNAMKRGAALSWEEQYGAYKEVLGTLLPGMKGS
ncbi:MAG: glycosyltransferase family 4 protein [Desulfomonilaceae bacterium]|nr:glycosyltransferase family 4 protein [Desulfomonilaceae bacterium]